ncbi:hypothetical protein [Streptomyces sporangiiformans]|uniref:hypothetical protein n=1 Tax=Streptomyces sporangiiformans TaxID=2315329 RepID=UPI001F0908D2|nr:hypothetical protein [Streptomyces sporangiiformans]
MDPTCGLSSQGPSGFTGATLTLDQQRILFRRWTTGPAVHPHEALLGMLALLHGASSREVKMLQSDDLDLQVRTARLGDRPHPGSPWTQRHGQCWNAAWLTAKPSGPKIPT